MAFEAFLAQDQLRPRRRRRITYAVSLALHGALLAVGIVYSFWHIEELSPPTVRVTFMSAAPPPPPPPPPPGLAAAGGGEIKKRALSKPRPTFTDLVQPKTIQPKKIQPAVEPKPAPKPDEPDDDDPDRTFGGGARGAKGGAVGGIIGGTVGGTVGGTIGGTIGGTTGAPAHERTQFLPPQMANSQKISGADPDLPAVLRRTSLVYVVAAKICVSKTGSIDSVSITQSSDSLLDRNVLAAVKGWRYRPFMSNNTAVPFCTLLRFEFKSE